MKEKGLSCIDIENNQLFLDADNVFWGITGVNPVRNTKAFKEKSKISNGVNGNSNTFIPRDLLSLYESKKNKCDQELKDFRFNSHLTAIYIDPTDLCNANCPYCYVPAKTRKHGRSMTEKELTFILQKIAKYFKGRDKKPVIIFHASEPLLVKEIIFKAIDTFKEHFYFGIQTNGLLLEDKDIEFIKNRKIGIGISLDASIPAINNRLRFTPPLRPGAGFSARDGGNYNRVIRAIDRFNGYDGLNVITTITKINLTNLPALVRFLHKKKVPCVLLNPVRLTQKNSRFLKPDDKYMARYFIHAVEEAMKCSMGSRHKIIIGNFANIILGIIAPTARRLMCDISPCGGGRCFLTITAAGDMLPCGEFIGLEGFCGGNIFEGSIDKAMRSTPFRKIRSRIVEKITECNVCSFRNICGAPCPAELHALGNMYPVRSKSLSVQTSNGMYKKAVFCEFYKEIIAYAFKLIAQGKEKYLLRQSGFKNLNYQYRIN